ncbi:MAG: 2-hydroxyacyl-CoA dehydratase [Gemmatimonadota bacterium]|nr:2-hydroxyacyl-CoA dehydratase [Gemmatimonadota bacterium]MDH5760533.1 2-hydroxyacyl-CoA dehydratase [Gemmatimonadota bacterium]
MDPTARPGAAPAPRPLPHPAVRLLDVPYDQGLKEVFWYCREMVEDPDFPTVKKWRETGGKVLGHFQVYFPEELAHAAGVLPVKFRGAQVEREQADSRFGSYLCSILRTSLELAMTGRLQVDMFVTHPICDAARNLAGIWSRNRPEPAQILYLPQNPNSAFSGTYLAQEYRRVLGDIEEMSGVTVSDEAIRGAIEVFNTNRRLLRELYSIKRDTPWLLPVDEAYVLTALGGIVTREEHNEVLEWALPRIRERDARRQDKIRVVFEGGFCEQPPLDLLLAIAQFCHVVDDDLLIGLRWILSDVPTEGDPVANLAQAYLDDSSYSPVQHDLRKPKEKMLIRRIRDAGAAAAIVSAAKMCEPGLDEQVAYSQALDEEDIPYFVTEFEERMTSFDHLQIQLETFVENLLFD